ncbi:hypothetical protein [Rhodococcus sp. ABRD24]|uniref:hypothetical protein n=1 Tax=Rhodococcus sp. ABRD24 TaxID=2507582 RepID=UPI0013F146A5|nr:hypothetical protein [Rhodococcus sp. ABRD24]
MTTLVSRPRPAQKGSRLEKQAISFTIGLYLFICAALLAIHYGAPEPAPAPADGASTTSGSSSTSPFNP